MQEQNESQNSQTNYDGFMSKNVGYLTEGSLQIRLDTTRLLRQIEMYLKGNVETWQTDANGNVVKYVQKIGEPLANKIGIQSIMSFLEIILSPAVVQGNFLTEDEFLTFMMNTRKEFAADLITNAKRFEIENYNFNGIVSKICSGIFMFLSRAINNKERESLTQGVKILENTTVKDNPKKTTNWLPF